MKRRTLLQWTAALAGVVPFQRVKLFAQPRELTAEAIATLYEIAPTVLPTALGAARTRAVVERFVAWTRGYREGVPLAHGYGHPRLVRSAATPVPAYLTQLTALEAEARAAGGRWAALDPDQRRAILDASFTKAGVRNLPARPVGQHVVADLMAFYFRSSEANDDCYNALINREVCRPITITTRRPESKGARSL
jgi:hypothetical protein